MSIKSFDDLNEIHISVLNEIGNIGSGNAATALSQMLSQQVGMSTPHVGIVNYNEAYEKLGGAEAVMVGMVLMLTGDVNGLMMFLIPSDVACTIVNLMAFTDYKDYTEIDEFGFSAVTEIGNIMSSSFVTAIATLTGLTANITPPSFTIDMLAAMLNLPFTYFAEVGDLFMFIKNELEISGKKTPVNILMMPDMDSLNKLMSALGLQ
jgi:chemotaxis protein CheC